MIKEQVKRIFEKFGYVVVRKDVHEEMKRALSGKNIFPMRLTTGIRAFEEWYDYIKDVLGDRIKKLKENLDVESQKTVDQYILMNISLATTYDLSECILLRQYDFINAVTPDVKYIKSSKRGVYKNNHGLDFIENIKSKLNGKDILDCGAFNGQSAICLYKNFKGHIANIYSFEPDDDNFKTLIQNTREYKTIVPVHAGVGGKTGKRKMWMKGGQSSGFNKIPKKPDKYNVKKTTVYSIDDYIEKNNVKPGFIKLDVEGLEYETVCGMKKTIEKFKPLLSISIYHNAKDFFEIKPLIESWDLGYTFMVRALNLYPKNRWFTNEFMLICEAK